MDKFSKKKRSNIMRAVRSRFNRSTELKFRAILLKAGIKGWKLGHGKYFANPDFVFPEKKIAVYIDGCFWHGCPYCKRPLPITNRSYWKDKINKNKKRDRSLRNKLRRKGWRIIRFWEHQLKSSKNDDLLNKLIKSLNRK